MTLTPWFTPSSKAELMSSVSSLALNRADGNLDLAITMQVTSQEAMNLLGNRTHKTNLAKWWEDLASAKARETAANDNNAPISIVA